MDIMDNIGLGQFEPINFAIKEIKRTLINFFCPKARRLTKMFWWTQRPPGNASDI